MNNMGGLEHYTRLATERADLLWGAIKASNGFYKSKITDDAYKSRVNVIFRIAGGNTKLEEKFMEEAKKAGIVQIRGHYFNPGIRISMYNAMPVAGVHYLLSFMNYF